MSNQWSSYWEYGVMELVEYLEIGYRMKLLVLRGKPEMAASLFEQLSTEDRQFRAFRRIERARLANPDHWPSCLASFFPAEQGPYRRS